MTPAQERSDGQLHELLEFMQFTADLSLKIHDQLDEAEILGTVARESLRLGHYAISALLLDDDGCHLRPLPAPSTPSVEHLRARARAEGFAPLTQFSADADRSPIWQPVIREGRTVQHTVSDVVRDMFSPPLDDLIIHALHLQGKLCLLTPLHKHHQTKGALAVPSTLGTAPLASCVTNLSQQISHALELAEARTQRAQAEAALRRSEATLRALLGATLEALFVIDGEGTILAANQALATRFGTTVELLVGSSVYDLLSPGVRATRKRRVAELLRSGKPMRFVDRRQGRVLRHSLYPICDEQGEIGAIAVFADDVTTLRKLNEALQQSEDRFRQMADVMPAMFWMTSPALDRVIFVSAAAERLCGYEPEDFYKEPGLWSRAMHPEDRDRILASWERHRNEPTETEYRIVRRDGEVRWVRHVASPVRDQAGELLMRTGFVEDITERKYAEAQLRQADRLSSLGLMAGGIAHGLRNPLSVISACAGMQLEFPNDVSLCTECAEKIDAATRRASLIIENLLRFARPEDVPMTAVDVVAAAEEALVLLADHLLLHRVTLCKELPAGLPAVRGNAHLLQQVFVELVLNACSAMPDGGTLTVSAALLDERWVEICFRDTGQGIAPENLSRVFDPFFTRGPSGVGLGLSVSHAIVRQHEGTISVASTVGQGSAFTIRLPRASETDTEVS